MAVCECLRKFTNFHDVKTTHPIYFNYFTHESSWSQNVVKKTSRFQIYKMCRFNVVNVREHSSTAINHFAWVLPFSALSDMIHYYGLKYGVMWRHGMTSWWHVTSQFRGCRQKMSVGRKEYQTHVAGGASTLGRFLFIEKNSQFEIYRYWGLDAAEADNKEVRALTL